MSEFNVGDAVRVNAKARAEDSDTPQGVGTVVAVLRDPDNGLVGYYVDFPGEPMPGAQFDDTEWVLFANEIEEAGDE